MDFLCLIPQILKDLAMFSEKILPSVFLFLGSYFSRLLELYTISKTNDNISFFVLQILFEQMR